MQQKSYDLIVIGAGPAGLIAAGRAAMLGAKVIVLEKMEKPARKLRITGKGRCNITNMRPFNEFIQEITPNPRFLNKAFGALFNKQIIEILHEMGVETVTERGQRVFPASGKAWDVADGLVKWAKNNGAEIYNHCPVTNIIEENKTVKGVKLEDNSEIIAPYIIIATGGKSYPATGSTGDGYRFAKQLGHTIVELRPSLTGIETHPSFPQLNKLNLRNVNASLYIDGRKVDEEFGEVEFTDYGVDGPCILRLSLKAIDAFRAGNKVHISIDLKPALSNDKLFNRIERDATKGKSYTVNMLLRDLLPSQLVSVFLRHLKLSSLKSAAELTNDERNSLINMLKGFNLNMRGHRDWNEAIITAGGISLNEIDSKTMASKLIDGLYFAGEVIDLSGNTGGYNLQIAFSTGWLAGQSAAEKFKER
ncbi:MAG TPA: NAD(P)/FAD-dependent oxidoreductase [Tenuifilaceae bacterium]|nr:NAD(P)/FAD-dependent oxidoreductase [Tenuifilaceae bacterium]HPI45482.1 NAD(P)/FAD-dependent oxidoreductase [Tenuifilaceae bacterium]